MYSVRVSRPSRPLRGEEPVMVEHHQRNTRRVRPQKPPSRNGTTHQTFDSPRTSRAQRAALTPRSTRPQGTDRGAPGYPVSSRPAARSPAKIRAARDKLDSCGSWLTT